MSLIAILKPANLLVMSEKYMFHNPDGINPVESRIVYKPEHYLYSRAIGNAGGTGYVNVTKLK